MAWKAIRIVCSEDAQKRLTVTRRDVMVDAREQLRVAADVVTLLPVGEPAAHHDVVRLAEVDPRVALDEGAQRDRGEVVGPDVPQRPLHGAPDGRPDGVDDDRFGHGSSSVADGPDRAPCWRRAT